MSRRRIRGGFAVLALLAGACSTVPEQQVGLYTQAFAEAEAAGNRLYDEIGPIVSAAELLVADAGSGGLSSIEPGAGDDDRLAAEPCVPDPMPEPFEFCFEPARFLVDTAPDEPGSVAARRRALAVVTDYNRLLTRLASGAEGDAVGAEVDRLAASVGSFAGLVSAGAGPLGSAAGALVGPLVGMVRDLQAGAELRQAALDGAPVVEKLLDALIADTSRMYALKRDHALERMADLVVMLQDEVLFSAEDLVEVRARPADTSRLEAVSQRINTALIRAGLPSVPLVNIAGRAGSSPFDGATEDDLEAMAVRAEALADAHEAEIDGLNAFHAALGEYVVLLDETHDALDGLVAAARAPGGVTIDGAAIASQAVDITLQAREVRRLLDDV